MAATLHVHDQPMAELNTTPLIDVMLVLLVMFILSVPVAMNETPFDLPQGKPPPGLDVRPENIVSIDAAGTALWNGNAVTQGELSAMLQASAHRDPEPLILFRPESGAPYAAALHTLNLIKASDPAAFAFSGNEQYAEFGKQAQPAR